MPSFRHVHRSSAFKAGAADRAPRVTRSLPVTKPGDTLEQAAGVLANRALTTQDRTAALAATRATATTAQTGLRAEGGVPDAGVVPASSSLQLPPPARTEWERAFWHDFSGVRVHSGPEAAATADRLGARAYSFGRHVVLGQGESVQGQSGRRLLAHELAHVVQHDASGRDVIARQAGGARDRRTDAEVRGELEKRTGKSFAELVSGLGLARLTRIAFRRVRWSGCWNRMALCVA